jgi:hypothetical protein
MSLVPIENFNSPKVFIFRDSEGKTDNSTKAIWGGGEMISPLHICCMCVEARGRRPGFWLVEII